MKHLYDSLRGCAKEEEVKAEFCKFFSNTMRTDNDASAGPDDDGLADGAEVAQASDPADPSDCGQAGNRVPVPFYFPRNICLRWSLWPQLAWVLHRARTRG